MSSRLITENDLKAILESMPSKNIAGEIKMWAGDTIPTGWLLCDGSAVSRTTYATLFSAIGTTWGAGDGSTTFNLPNFVGRMPLGASATASTQWITITGENEYSNFTLDSPTYARFGTGTTWVYKTLDAGTYYPSTANLISLFGSDPSVGTAKCVQVALNVGGNGGYSWWRLSLNDIPAHTHGYQKPVLMYGTGGNAAWPGGGSNSKGSDQWGYYSTASAGGGRNISQMPPFAIVKYIICAV